MKKLLMLIVVGMTLILGACGATYNTATKEDKVAIVKKMQNNDKKAIEVYTKVATDLSAKAAQGDANAINELQQWAEAAVEATTTK